MRSATTCLATLVLVSLVQLAAAQTEAWQGQKLADYLDFLNGQGAKIIYSSDLVTEEMLLPSEPGGGSSERDIQALLSPFSLTVTTGPAGSMLVVALPGDDAAVV